jgi:hypothetical protein
MSGAGLTRRAFVARAAAVSSFVGVLPSFALGREAASIAFMPEPVTGSHPTPIISFHLDQPYLDATGTGVPYEPPAGARGADALGALSEAELFCCMQRY